MANILANTLGTSKTIGAVYQNPHSYELAAEQYATSSVDDPYSMRPALIIQPRSKEEIKFWLQYAKGQKIAVAIRSGGHQYSGASSTSGRNIQLDLKQTFRNEEDFQFSEKDGKAFVRTSVSWNLSVFNRKLGEHKVFLPHGQCSPVCVGGHVQTGGYGQLGRSFGLLGDYVVELEIIDHNGEFQTVTKDSDKDLFYAILGGSPGNLGLLTHVTLEVNQDKDYVGSRGLQYVYPYTQATLEYLLAKTVDMSDNTDMKRNYDLCITVVSEKYEIEKLFPINHKKAVFAKGAKGFKVSSAGSGKDPPEIPDQPKIVVFAQWVPFGTGDDDTATVNNWFNMFKGKDDPNGKVDAEPLAHIDHVGPMSELTKFWIFESRREFDLPYVKRTHLTNSTDLKQDNYEWSNWIAGRINQVVEADGLHISAQIQPFGGKHSKFITNEDGTRAYSWREDTTMVITLDVFYNPDKDGKKRAEKWESENDRKQIGTGLFSTHDRRVLWGSYGEHDLHSVWPCYYDNATKYNKLRAARLKADPDGLFTPNEFSVRRFYREDK